LAQTEIIRAQAEALYPTTLMIRAYFMTSMAQHLKSANFGEFDAFLPMT